MFCHVIVTCIDTASIDAIQQGTFHPFRCNVICYDAYRPPGVESFVYFRCVIGAELCMPASVQAALRSIRGGILRREDAPAAG
jgi:hypothetical protein